MKSRCLSIVLTLLAPLPALAQALADRVPDDAMIYVGWRGADSPGDAYAASHLKAFLDASEIPQLVDQTMAKLLDKMVEADPSTGELVKVLHNVGGEFWHCPVAFYIGPVDGLEAGNVPVPRAAVLVQAGDGAAQLKARVTELLAKIPPENGVPISVDQGNGIVAIMLGNASIDLTGKSQTTLAHRKEFVETMKQVGSDPTVALYVDAEALQETVTRGIVLYGQQQGQHVWSIVQGDLGLSGLKRIAVTAGFDGANWSAQSFIAAPAPRRGLLELFDNPAVSDATLKRVPQSATMVIASHLDATKLLKAARAVAGKFAPGGTDQVDSSLAIAGVALGFNVEHDLIDPIGDEWALYAAPDVGGAGPLGLVLVNHTRDAAKLEATMTVLERLANRGLNANSTKGEPRPQFLDSKIGDLAVHYLDTPIVSPAWGFKDGNLYFALFPQTVAAAASGREKSILDNENFVALRGKLGPAAAGAQSISFFDLPRATPQGYPYMLAVARLLGFADMFGIQTPPAVLPPLDKLMPLMEPAGQISWADDAGIHTKGIDPFPGAELFVGPEMILLQANGFIGPAVMSGIAKARQARSVEAAHVVTPLPPPDQK